MQGGQTCVFRQILRALDNVQGPELAEAIEVYESACAVVGGKEDQAALWFCAYNKHLDAVPAELLSSRVGRERLGSYIERFRLR